MPTHPLKARAIALYLPQFHPIPENDEWWGKGFTEWTNVVRAKPLFAGHYQPRIPADLGYYDLRSAESRQAQASLAGAAGIEAFCYWHYWFAGRRILERPFQEVLESGQPRFSFCLAWANESWTGIWHGKPRKMLIEQTYPGEADHRRHFEYLMTAFNDPRYFRVEGRPLFMIYRPLHLPEIRKVTDLWRDLAARAGLAGLHIVGYAPDRSWNGRKHGLDAVSLSTLHTIFGFPRHGIAARILARRSLRRIGTQLFRIPCEVFRYRDIVDHLAAVGDGEDEYYPCALANWDNTPRSGSRGWVLHESTPELFRGHLRRCIAQVEGLPAERRIVFIKSWNEWAEGNHLEPDVRFGHGYLDVTREELSASVPHTEQRQSPRIDAG